jgi:hypothetical protein
MSRKQPHRQGLYRDELHQQEEASIPRLGRAEPRQSNVLLWRHHLVERRDKARSRCHTSANASLVPISSITLRHRNVLN